MSASEVATRVAELAARYSLPRRSESALRALLSLLSGDAGAPTTIRDGRAVIDDHLADSLVALDLDEVRRAKAIADIGSGAGLPGLALAAALPAAEVWLVESNRRKCEFLEKARHVADLDNAHVVNVRAELWTDGFGRCELVTARAVGPLSLVAEYAAPLLVVGGALVAWRGARDPEEETTAERAAAELGLEPAQIVEVHPYPGARHRHLHLTLKVRPTPERFPRRPGMAAKRPLGGLPRAEVERRQV